MKLSNKTLVIFFGVILAYTLVAFAEIRLKGELRELSEENSISESAPLENLRYLVIPDDLDKQVTISSSSEPRIELKSVSGNILSKLKYEFKNDTLLLQKLDLDVDEEHFHITIYAPLSGFDGLSIMSSYVELSEIKQASFSIVQSGGRISLEDNNEFNRLNIVATNGADIDIFNSKIDTVSVHLDDSHINIHFRVNRLEGSIVNGAVLYSNGVSDIQLKKDKGSSFRIFD